MSPTSPSPRPSPNNCADASPAFASESPTSLDATPQPAKDLDLCERTQAPSAFPSSRPHRDPLTMKLPTLPTERHNNHALTNQNFDRNLTVEKAKFETPPTLIDDDDAMLSSSTEGQAPAFSSSASTIGGGLSPTGKQVRFNGYNFLLGR
ncbi:hypothetical protein BCR43DRAFT_236366 [Syncephalastrum racemosum]|uniref:Uncharacterized protein n=1 Tax=Syncephalastrum racemosum TaxID=13706 RepID=A0A1X2HEK8_SYNRA|nr:hypothetical protein BCR43DRAFT_236366 [Syncephalastrum racemosum]